MWYRYCNKNYWKRDTNVSNKHLNQNELVLFMIPRLVQPIDWSQSMLPPLLVHIIQQTCLTNQNYNLSRNVCNHSWMECLQRKECNQGLRVWGRGPMRYGHNCRVLTEQVPNDRFASSLRSKRQKIYTYFISNISKCHQVPFSQNF